LRSLTRTLITTVPLIGLIVAGWIFLLFGQDDTVSAEEREPDGSFETNVEGRADRPALSAVRLGWEPPKPGEKPRVKPRAVPQNNTKAAPAGAGSQENGGDKQKAKAKAGGAKPSAAQVEDVPKAGAKKKDPAKKPAKAPYPPPLVREPLTAEEAAEFFGLLKKKKRYVFDPVLYVRAKPAREWTLKHTEHPQEGWTLKTNSRGMFGLNDVRESAPDVRILVAGDTQAVGKCAPAESWVQLLQERLQASDESRSVETLNAAQNGYNLYNYVGTIEKFWGLKPDVFVIVVFGGNDFAGSMPLYRHFQEMPPAKSAPHDPAKLFAQDAELRGAGGQEMAQILHFANNPEDIATAKTLLDSATAEIIRECRRRDVTPFFVYLPPSLRGQPKYTKELAARALEVAKMPERALAVSGDIADSWIQFMRKHKVAHLDMRSIFRSYGQPLYWASDQHLNLEGHSVMARAVERSLIGIMEKEKR